MIMSSCILYTTLLKIIKKKRELFSNHKRFTKNTGIQSKQNKMQPSPMKLCNTITWTCTYAVTYGYVQRTKTD